MRRRLLIATVSVLIAGLVATIPAAADLAQGRIVSENPVDHTPHVLDGTVRAFAVVGDTVVVGGDFSEVRNAGRRSVLKRDNLFTFNLRTGVIGNLAAKFDGPVYALAVGPNDTVYVGGSFSNVNHRPQRGLTQVSIWTGESVPGFAGTVNFGDVRALAVSGPWLYAGGTFTRIGGLDRVALARLNPTTGAADPAFNPRLGAPHLSRAKVEDLAISPNGSRLVAIGAIEEAAGEYRAQLAMFDLWGGRLADWYTDAYTDRCLAGFETYMRGVDFSPDGSYFVVVTTGRTSHPDKTCDTAARFNVAGSGLHRPVWVNHTGGDSLYAVSVTGPAVYVAGHQRWQNNPYGHESAGKGAVSRKGIAALHPVTGLALDWNPTRTRGVGVRALVSTPVGLLVGSDTEELGHEFHARLGMFPTTG